MEAPTQQSLRPKLYEKLEEYKIGEVTGQPNFVMSAGSSAGSSNSFKGTKFKPRMVVILRVTESRIPVFGLFELILFGQSITFVYSCLLVTNFDEHVNAYEVSFCIYVLS